MPETNETVPMCFVVGTGPRSRSLYKNRRDYIEREVDDGVPLCEAMADAYKKFPEPESD